MLKLLKEPNTGQYVQSLKVLLCGCWCCGIHVSQGLSRAYFHLLHAQGIQCISHVSCPSLESKRV